MVSLYPGSNRLFTCRTLSIFKGSGRLYVATKTAKLAIIQKLFSELFSASFYLGRIGSDIG